MLAAEVALVGEADAAGGTGRARVHVQDAAADDAGEHIQELWRLHSRPGKMTGKTLTKLSHNISDIVTTFGIWQRLSRYVTTVKGVKF